MKSRYTPDELNLLSNAYARYLSELHLLPSQRKIEDFLCSTKDFKIPESRLLIGLAAALTNELGWSGVSEIYKYVLGRGERREGIYINWLACAIELLKKEEHNEKNSRAIIEDCLAVLKGALVDNPRHDGFAYLTGYFYFSYANFCQQDVALYEQALIWFKQAEQWQLAYYREIDNRIKFYLGQSYLALRQWPDALASYASVDEELLSREESDENVEELKQGILTAKAAIAENEKK